MPTPIVLVHGGGFHRRCWEFMSPDNVKILFGNDMNDEQLAWCVERLVPEARA